MIFLVILCLQVLSNANKKRKAYEIIPPFYHEAQD